MVETFLCVISMRLHLSQFNFSLGLKFNQTVHQYLLGRFGTLKGMDGPVQKEILNMQTRAAAGQGISKDIVNSKVPNMHGALRDTWENR